MSQATAIFNKLANLEQEVQKLKVQVYLNLPKTQQAVSLYSQTALTKALRTSRKQIWQEKYGKKVQSLS